MRISTRMRGERAVAVGDKLHIEVEVNNLDPDDHEQPLRFKDIGWTRAEGYTVLDVIPRELKVGDFVRAALSKEPMRVIAIHEDHVWCRQPGGACLTFRCDALTRESA